MVAEWKSAAEIYELRKRMRPDSAANWLRGGFCAYYGAGQAARSDTTGL